MMSELLPWFLINVVFHVLKRKKKFPKKSGMKRKIKKFGMDSALLEHGKPRKDASKDLRRFHLATMS
jgi:hypothetical protein